MSAKTAVDNDIEKTIITTKKEIESYESNPSEERKWINVNNKDLDLMLEKFSYVKFDIEPDTSQPDKSNLRIIRLASAGHKAVIGKLSGQFGNFCEKVEESCGRLWFSHGGGVTKIGGKRCDPDNALKFRRIEPDGKITYMMCLIFEIELHNRTIRKVHERMMDLMSGLPTVVYGVALKYYSRGTGEAPFQGVALVYEKNVNNDVKCISIKDIGTTEFNHFNHIPSDITDIPISKPTSYPEKNAKQYLTTCCPDFYSFVPCHWTMEDEKFN